MFPELALTSSPTLRCDLLLTNEPCIFFDLLVALQFLINRNTHAVTLIVRQKVLLSSKASYSSNIRSCVRRTASSMTVLSSSVSLVPFILGFSGHSLLTKSQSGPANQFPLSIFTIVAPLHPRSAGFNSDAQNLQMVLIGPAVSSLLYLRRTPLIGHPT